MSIICTLLLLYAVAVFARIILSWFPIDPGSPLVSVNSFLYTITEPVLGPVRRVIPDIPMGNTRLDLSPTIVVFAIFILRAAICH